MAPVQRTDRARLPDAASPGGARRPGRLEHRPDRFHRARVGPVSSRPRHPRARRRDAGRRRRRARQATGAGGRHRAGSAAARRGHAAVGAGDRAAHRAGARARRSHRRRTRRLPRSGHDESAGRRPVRRGALRRRSDADPRAGRRRLPGRSRDRRHVACDGRLPLAAARVGCRRRRRPVLRSRALAGRRQRPARRARPGRPARHRARPSHRIGGKLLARDHRAGLPSLDARERHRRQHPHAAHDARRHPDRHDLAQLHLRIGRGQDAVRRPDRTLARGNAAGDRRRWHRDPLPGSSLAGAGGTRRRRGHRHRADGDHARESRRRLRAPRRCGRARSPVTWYRAPRALAGTRGSGDSLPCW